MQFAQVLDVRAALNQSYLVLHGLSKQCFSFLHSKTINFKALQTISTNGHIQSFLAPTHRTIKTISIAIMITFFYTKCTQLRNLSANSNYRLSGSYSATCWKKNKGVITEVRRYFHNIVERLQIKACYV